MNLGAFWDAASPGINSAIDTARQQHLYSIHQQHELEMHLLDQMQTGGDPELQNYARNKLMEIATLGPKYKPGSALKEIQGIMQGGGAVPAPAGAGGATGTGVTGQAGPPAPPTAAAPSADVTKPIPADSGGSSAGPMAPMGGGGGAAAQPATSPTQAGSVPMKAPAAGGPPPQAAPAAAPAPAPAAAAQPKAPEDQQDAAIAAFAKTLPPEEQQHFGEILLKYHQLLKATGIGTPQAPDLGAIRQQVAKQYGYSPDELENPNFAYVNHFKDPQRAAAQADYRQRLQHAQDQAGTEYRSEAGSYRSAALGTLGQVYSSDRAAAAESGREDRADKRVTVEQNRFDAREKDRRDHEDRLARQYAKTQSDKAALAEAEHLDRQAAALKPPTMGGAPIEKPADRAAREKKVQELREQASSLRRGILGTGGPPTAPPDPAKVQRLQSLADRARQLGGAQHLRPEERQELQDGLRLGIRL